MRIMMACAAGVLLLAAAPAAALDCARVRALDGQGKRASEIARELGITTPDVQACLAGEPEEQSPSRERAGGLGLAPQLPASDSPLPRSPNQ